MGVVVLVHAAMSALILAFHIALAVGVTANLRKEKARARVGKENAQGRAGDAVAAITPVEVVVAVRNEEKTLPALLAALAAQTDTGCRFLFVDDRSTDGTRRLLDEFCAAEGERARVIHNVAEPVGLTGKQAALDLAFAQVSGQVILFTDGDCLPPRTWVEEMASHFDDPAVGIVLGRIELPPSASFLADFQAFEQPLLNQYNFGSVGIGVPTGCFGNNMAVRALALKETGGFARIGYSVTEDALLLDAVSRAGKWKVAVCSSLRAASLTQPKMGWKGFVDQHTRWNAGGLFSPDLVTRASYVFVVLIYLVGSLLVLPLGILDWRVPVLSLNSFLCIGLLAALGGVYEGRNRPRYYLRLLPYLFFFGFFYSYITLRAFVRRPFEWKGRELRA